jgi:hypothetical protein
MAEGRRRAVEVRVRLDSGVSLTLPVPALLALFTGHYCKVPADREYTRLCTPTDCLSIIRWLMQRWQHGPKHRGPDRSDTLRSGSWRISSTPKSIQYRLSCERSRFARNPTSICHFGRSSPPRSCSTRLRPALLKSPTALLGCTILVLPQAG